MFDCTATPAADGTLERMVRPTHKPASEDRNGCPSLVPGGGHPDKAEVSPSWYLPCGGLFPSAPLGGNGRLVGQRRDLPVFVADVLLEPPDGELRLRVFPAPRRGRGAVDRGAQQLVVADSPGGGVGAGGNEHGRRVPLLRPPDGAPHQLEACEESLFEVDLDVGQLRRRRPPVVQHVVHPHGPALLCALLSERSSSTVPGKLTP